jgi:hypothetical protein
MEPDRFDDVELQVFGAPVPRAPRRGARWALAIVAAALTAGTLAAGASALTGSDGGSAPPAARQQLHTLQSDAAWHAPLPCAKYRGATAPLD